MKFITYLTAVFAIIIGLSGCGRTTHVNAINSTVTPGHSQQQVRDAILKAGKGKWVMHEEKPGVISARLDNRTHSVQVRIPYSSSSYSIDYVSSNNLLASDGKIHRNYFRWVNHLDARIQLNLSTVK